jgi:hypothetical protein
MKPFPSGRARVAGVALVMVPLLVGLAWRGSLVPCDYVAQAALVMLMLLLPFCPNPDSGFGRGLALLCVLGFIWGVWRLLYFDPVTQNDIPGMVRTTFLAWAT